VGDMGNIKSLEETGEVMDKMKAILEGKVLKEPLASPGRNKNPLSSKSDFSAEPALALIHTLRNGIREMGGLDSLPVSEIPVIKKRKKLKRKVIKKVKIITPKKRKARRKKKPKVKTISKTIEPKKLIRKKKPRKLVAKKKVKLRKPKQVRKVRSVKSTKAKKKTKPKRKLSGKEKLLRLLAKKRKSN
jgi:hypothetical protein